MRLVFAGTPSVALPFLDALSDSAHEVVAVVTRPDAPQGRSKRPVPSPVATWATARGLELLTPERPSEPAFVARLRELAPDCCPVVAYGALIPEPVLAVPPLGFVNVHFSLLPAWRGAAPVQRAIMEGDPETGITIFSLVRALDAGPVLSESRSPLGPSDTAGEVLERLAGLGAAQLVSTLDELERGELELRPQTGEVSLAPKLTPDEVRLNFERPAVELDRTIRGANPSPVAWTTVAGERFKVLLARPVLDVDLPPGQVHVERRRVLVGTGVGSLELLTVQPLGRKSMAATDWARGLREADPWLGQ
ncbi:MAG TPA: methionyl-tRNA formyltransferase [Propionibacteriaceae bacterium]|jgi:methionyl-tRNA formyltransferase|nr:methionyl-tRNA formyltransferase [Micropruina sp.]HBX80837.1 methionyl-tRNA formyltransferase [Propionibacteriaceae bacterium]HBY22707.1 methionyl-tRNA formyltransferase [Propionibacteriaceae bacterium]